MSIKIDPNAERDLQLALEDILRTEGDQERRHTDADEALLRYIEATSTRGSSIVAIYNEIPKWYA